MRHVHTTALRAALSMLALSCSLGTLACVRGPKEVVPPANQARDLCTAGLRNPADPVFQKCGGATWRDAVQHEVHRAYFERASKVIDTATLSCQLRVQPAPDETVRLSLHVAPDGAVTQAKADAQTAFGRCMEATALRLKLPASPRRPPPPGGAATPRPAQDGEPYPMYVRIDLPGASGTAADAPSAGCGRSG